MAAMNGKHETRTFLRGEVKYHEQTGCCASPHTKRCVIATGVIGGIILLLGLILMVLGKGILQGAILKSMSLAEGSGRLETWLSPEKAGIRSHLTGYGWNVTNPDEVVQGAKPILQEVGPFVYQAIYIKDATEEDGSNNFGYNDDGETFTYRPRRFYFLDRAQSVGDPDATMITVPNIPLLTALYKIKDDFSKGIQANVLLKTGKGTPFVTVPFTGLLWGYYDDMPCIKLNRPEGCPAPAGEVDLFADGGDSWDDGGDDDWDKDDWDKRRKREAPAKEENLQDFKRKKREVAKKENLEDSERKKGEVPLEADKEEDWDRVKRQAEEKYSIETQESLLNKIEHLHTANFTAMWKPKMDWIVSKDSAGATQCDCEWGLFRDRNVTLRKAIKEHHGVADLQMKGRIVEYDNSPWLNWWEKNSVCDAVGGQDSATLPPGVKKEEDLDIFIALMCRRITMEYEEEREYKGLTALRFIPPRNAFGSHKDTNPETGNPANKCYCIEEEGFECFESGVLNIASCKRSESLPTGVPLALSYPHFYQADQSFHDAVVGMNPDKEKHQMFADVSPEFGFPLAFRPRFQLNVVIRRDPTIEIFSKFPERLVLPFLWAQDGFGEPSDDMAEKIKFGLSAPNSLPLLGGAALLVIGGGMIMVALCWTLWQRRKSQASESIALQ